MVEVKDMATAYVEGLQARINSFQEEIDQMEERYTEARVTAQAELSEMEAHYTDCVQTLDSPESCCNKTEGGETASTD
jgi:hypothetical protein|tara:strand:- start:103 stop:336 length:234 start_codon:yes stop_codon:yes gene_type:complete